MPGYTAVGKNVMVLKEYEVGYRYYIRTGTNTHVGGLL